ncbi:hypothetical protein [Pseudoalteromonas rubra]|uniref:hypothetical protein n=1 Tax=Pseudoalteromonas rubra TaxID=43658 RepID=UPI002DBB9746|nr:hypothetical protein [Pseudoalteromonas rubra]MEC4091578.1 hypothetical protein [Pseudoalteromonas rubra]
MEVWLMGGGGDNTIKDTPERKALADISAQKYEHFDAMLKPVRNEWIEEMTGQNEQRHYDALQGKVSTGNASVFSKQQQQAQKALAASGANPGSGRYQRSLQELSQAQAEIGADTMNRATSAQQDNTVKALGSVVALGEKKSAEAIDGLNTLSAQAMDRSRSEAQDRMQTNQSLADLAGTTAGFAYSAHKNNDEGGS